MGTAEPQNTAKADLIVFQKIRHQLIQYSSNPSKLREITEPIFGPEWDRRAIGALGSAPIGDLVEIAKVSESPQELIDRIRSALVTSYFGESIIPPPPIFFGAKVLVCKKKASFSSCFKREPYWLKKKYSFKYK